MFKPMFRIVMIVALSLLVVWWLNTPLMTTKKDTRPLIVVTTPILKDLTHALLGSDARVTALQPAPPTNAKQVIESADLIIMHGTSLDGPYINLKKQTKKAPHLIRITDIPELPADTPYYWMAIDIWMKQTHYMHHQLKAIFPNQRSEINYRNTTYLAALQTRYQTMRQQLRSSHVNRPPIATTHPSFIPFLAPFNLKSMVISLTSNTQNNRENIITELKAQNISMIHPNHNIPSPGLDALVRDALAQGVVLTIAPPVMVQLSDSGVPPDGEGILRLMDANFNALSSY
ncbi:MAG: metal ABC transporter substrate-binding protein [Candidatus Marinamargulisbacteria bacterium]